MTRDLNSDSEGIERAKLQARPTRTEKLKLGLKVSAEPQIPKSTRGRGAQPPKAKFTFKRTNSNYWRIPNHQPEHEITKKEHFTYYWNGTAPPN